MIDEEIEKNFSSIIELFELTTKISANSIAEQERFIKILENIVKILTIQDERIKKLEHGAGHTHWWQLL